MTGQAQWQLASCLLAFSCLRILRGFNVPSVETLVKVSSTVAAIATGPLCIVQMRNLQGGLRVDERYSRGQSRASSDNDF